jgi:CRP-like cAMP-binding protein
MGCSCLSKHSKGPIVKIEPRNSSKIILIEEKVENLVSCSTKSLVSAKSHKKIKETPSVGLDDHARVFIKRSLMRSGVFSNEVNHSKITSEDIDEIVNAFEFITFLDRECLFYKDDFPSEEMFIAKKGKFRGWKDSDCKVTMKEGDLIGELGFFYENPRLLSIIVEGDQSSAYRLLKRDFKAIVEKGRNLRNIKILNALSDFQKLVFRERTSLSNFFRGKHLIYIIQLFVYLRPCIYFRNRVLAFI